MRRIQLYGRHGTGKFAIVDEDDFDYLNQWKWYLTRKGYVIRSERPRGCEKIDIFMHRVVNDTPEGLLTDHINHDRLDNRRTNLRSCTNGDNIANSRVRSDNSSGYRGVYQRGMRWVAQITNRDDGGHMRHLGTFNTPLEVAHAYDMAAVALWGEYANPNIKK